jgi:general secretion pathway protein D
VTQALAQIAPDLRITVSPNTNQLILTGSSGSLGAAREMIAQLDVAQKLVVLDTQVLELDESVSKNLGLEFTNPLLSTTYTEVTPPANANGVAQQLLGLAPLTRSPLTLGFTLNLALATGHGRVLANPRITTVSGRTASIRAGDTISIQTTAGGGAGTVATTQLQTFQTGVTLDITPIVNADNFVSVTIHPTVNSETGLLNGIPQISTRDTQTTVSMKQDETLVIGGLIQSDDTRTDTKIPFLGDLPLVGKLFTSSQVDTSRNELVITVTPHIIDPATGLEIAGRGLPPMSRPEPLPEAPTSPLNAPPPPVSIPATPTPKRRRGAQSDAARSQGYTFGLIPATTAAGPNDGLTIYYATVTPSLPWTGKTLTINAITSDNVQRVTFAYGGGFSAQLSQTTAGHWQATFPFPSAAEAAVESADFVKLIAQHSDDATSATAMISLSSP